MIELKSFRVRLKKLNMHYLRAGTGEPLFLLHGFPQHSRMWHKILPTLAEKFTVIAPDARGMGGTTITPGGYDKRTMAADLFELVEHLGFSKINLAGYDLGAGTAYAFAAEHPEMVSKLAIMEFGLAGFGYEKFMTPAPDWDAASNWQLAFFTVPDAAEHFLRGRERDLLAWFFWHAAHDPNAVDQADFEIYVRELQKPGALRAGINYYAAVWKDTEDNKEYARTKLRMPVLAVGGEASGGSMIGQLLEPVAADVRSVSVERAGHWLADENPEQLATEMLDFFTENK